MTIVETRFASVGTIAVALDLRAGSWAIRKLHRSKHFGVIFRIGTGKRLGVW